MKGVKNIFLFFLLCSVFLTADIPIALGEEGELEQLASEWEQKYVTLVEFKGGKHFKYKELVRISGIEVGEALSKEALLESKERILQRYNREGYFQTEVVIEIIERGAFAQVKVRYLIREGYQSRIESTTLSGDMPEDLNKAWQVIEQTLVGLPASEDNINDAQQALLVLIRKEGYLQGSVDLESSELSYETSNMSVAYRLNARTPLSITFAGSTIFSNEKLLSPLRLETRTVPFTPNAIANLCKEISELYQARGYFFATADYAENKNEMLRRITKRRSYRISIREGEQVRIGDLNYVGNLSFSSSELSDVVETTESGWGFLSRWKPGFLIKEQLADDLVRIEEFYRDEGYFGTTATFSLEYDDKKKLLSLTFIINEAERKTIKEVEVVWSDFAESSFNSDVLSVVTKLEVGQPIRPGDIEKERDRLLEEVLSFGYPNAQIDARTNIEEGSVRYIVNAGKEMRIGEVVIDGNYSVRDRVIKRVLSVNSGDLWTRHNVRESQRSLYGLGFFRSVSIKPASPPLDNPVEGLLVEVKERDTGRYDLGASISTEDGLHLKGEVGQRNFFGTGHSLSVGIDGYFKTGGQFFDAGTARVSYTVPRVQGTKVDWLNQIYFQSSIELFDQFSYDRFGYSTNFSYPLFERLSGSIGYRGFHEDVFDVAPEVIIGLDDAGNSFYSQLEGELLWDKRDSSFNPRKGYYSALNVVYAADFLGSDIEYLGTGFSFSTYTSFWSRFVWANNLQVDYLMTLGGTETIPLGHRLFYGGWGILRGYSRHSIAPRAANGTPVGGDLGTVFNTELYFDITENLAWLTFLDIGQAYLLDRGSYTGDPHDASNLRYSPGVGFRYRTPIGPVSMDLGFATDREFGEGPFRLNVSIGGMF